MSADNGRGPYLYGRRVRALDVSLGRVYESHGPQGQPALLQVPTGESPPLALEPVQVLVTTYGGAGGVAVEVQGEPPAQGVAAGAVRDALEAGVELVEALEHRPDVAGHLSRVRPRAQLAQVLAPSVALQGQTAPSGPRPVHVRWLPELVAAVACGLLLWPQATVNVRVQEAPAEELVWDVPASPVDIQLTDIVYGASTREPMTIRRRLVIPNGPLEGQDTPPCRSPAKAIRGGCWLQLKQDAPCPPNSAEHDGGCWVPIRGEERMPMSIGRERGR